MKTTIQILDFVPNSERTMEQFLLGLNEALRTRGWRSVYVFAGHPAEHFRRQLRNLDSPYLLADFPLGWKQIPALAAPLARFEPRAIQTCFMSPFNPALWRLKRWVRARHFIVTDQSSGAGSKKEGVRRVLAQLRGALASTYVGHVVTVSEFNRLRDIERAFLPPRKIRTIYNGVDTVKYQPAPPTEHSHAITIAFVGQLIPEKGVHTLLQAFKELTDEDNLPLALKIAGQGRSAEELKAYCTQHGLTQVEFLGQIRWVNELFAQADIAVVPSIWEEAFGFTVAEAMACGACVVASDAGGIPEVVGESGEAGLIFPRGDVGALKNALRGLIHDPARRARLGRFARSRVANRFSVQRMIDGYAALYDELDSPSADRVAIAVP